MQECLDEETIAALVDGSLSADRLPAVEAHLARCMSCEEIVGDAVFGAGQRTMPVERQTPVEISPKQGADSLEDTRPSGGWPAAVTSELQPSTIVAEKYLIERVLGHGGMGRVFAARHLTLGHEVAIKVLRFEGTEMAARFLREAQTCARLGNEHIVRAFDLGRLPDGAPYLVMERLTGEDLAQVIARGPVPISAAVQHVVEACTGIAAAHAAGIVHRDLKPANLFLTERPGKSPLVKVVDFGLSKVLKASGGSAGLSLTSTGKILGSPLYMSPEQIRASREVTDSTDIWSLGVILYELLTGTPPFAALGVSALAIKIATEPPERPSLLRPEIGSALEAVVLRCLEKAPERRFKSASELHDALAPFVASKTAVSLDPFSRSRRRRTMVWGGLAALIVLGVGFTILQAKLGVPDAALGTATSEGELGASPSASNK